MGFPRIFFTPEAACVTSILFWLIGEDHPSMVPPVFFSFGRRSPPMWWLTPDTAPPAATSPTSLAAAPRGHPTTPQPSALLPIGGVTHIRLCSRRPFIPSSPPLLCFFPHRGDRCFREIRGADSDAYICGPRANGSTSIPGGVMCHVVRGWNGSEGRAVPPPTGPGPQPLRTVPTPHHHPVQHRRSVPLPPLPRGGPCRGAPTT